MRRWLFTICKNVFLRGNERARAVGSLDDPGNEAIAAARTHSALVASGESTLLDRIDVRPAILRALHALAPVYRTAVILVDLEGYDYAEAADVLEIPVGTVRSRLFRARRLLQDMLYLHARDAGIGPRAVALDGNGVT